MQSSLRPERFYCSNRQYFYFVLLLLSIFRLPAAIINIPADGSLIQNWIDAATPGDTILMHPGVYQENLNFNGNNIVVGSLFLTTGDTTYISQTILDGNSNGTTVTFNSGEDTTAALVGLTITNGLGQIAYPGFSAGGIICDTASSPRLAYLNITGNVGAQGGGIACRFSDPIIENVSISGNNAAVGGGMMLFHSSPALSDLAVVLNNALNMGGGIFCAWSQFQSQELMIADNQAGHGGGGLLIANSAVQMTGTSLINNQANNGGGLFCFQSDPTLDQFEILNNSAQNDGGGVYIVSISQPHFINTTINGNSAVNNGGGIYCTDYSHAGLSGTIVSDNSAGNRGGGICCNNNSSLYLNNNNRSSIYFNTSLPIGNDITVDNSSIFPVILDTFTVVDPGLYHVIPHDLFSFDILNGKVQQVQDDLYISPDGNNANSGISAAEPLKTILFAQSIMLADSANPQIIHLANGIYSRAITGEYFPIELDDYIGLAGETTGGVIIDGENQTSSFVFNQSRGNSLSNCTIINGAAEYGGGIYCNQSDPEFTNLSITGNQAVDGGGIYCTESSPVLTNISIRDNYASGNGGGLFMTTFSNPQLANVSIVENNAVHQGGGMYCAFYANPVMDYTNRCNIHSNLSGSLGNDVASTNFFPIAVIVDTFTVLLPANYHAYPSNQFNFNILNAIVYQVQADLYVSPQGANTSSGLTPDEPLRTISFAIAKLLAGYQSPHKMFLADGYYSPSATGEQFPIHLNSYISLTGESEPGVILDPEQQGSALICDISVDNTIENLTITGGLASQGGGISSNYSNPVLSNITITDCQATNYGGGLAALYSDVTINNLTLRGNQGRMGGGLYFQSTNSTLSNTLIVEKRARNSNNAGGGIYCLDSDLRLQNVTISENSATENGGGIYVVSSNLTVVNSILWHDGPQEIRFSETLPTSVLILAYNDIMGGAGAIQSNNNSVIELDGNIMANPYFFNPGASNYQLQDISPCIDAGTAFYAWYLDTLINLPPENYYSYNPDMGAIESAFVEIDAGQGLLPQSLTLHQNYPNPFNPVTTIRYELPGRTGVRLTIYDVMGREVAVLTDDIRGPGVWEVNWAATAVASGIYFYRLQAGDQTITRKLMVLK